MLFSLVAGELTVKCPQGKSRQARGRRGRGVLEEFLVRVRVRDYRSAESVCVSTVNFTRFIQS